MKKNNGNSGLYGRVTKKQMGGAAKPVGMSGPGFLAGEAPPTGSIIRPDGKIMRSGGSGIVAGDRTPYDKYLEVDFKDLFKNGGKDRKGPQAPPVVRTNDFRDEDMNGTDDRDESPRGKKRPPGRGGNSRGTIKTGPGRGPRGPSRDQLQRIQEMLAGKADRGGRNPGTRMPRLPGGGRLRPPEMGPNPDAERMGPRRFEGMSASIIDALGIKSGKMGDKSRKEPPRPKTTGGRRGRGRRD
jgi:hypothetical protein